MLSKSAFFRPMMWRRIGRSFCSKIPAATANPDQASQPFKEQPISLEGNKMTVKFNENTVCYELPDRIGGTTFGRIAS